MQIAITSGKGGTGKTFLATNLAVVMQEDLRKDITYLDCDVEGANGHLFFETEKVQSEEVVLKAPMEVDNDRCTGCRRCTEVCMYNALALINEEVLLFKELCHLCGACTLVCPEDAIIEGDRIIGELVHGSCQIDIYYAELMAGEGGMSPRLIRRVKSNTAEGINILDSPPGTACPAVETVKGTDLCVLVTDPTPFGLHDLRLAVNMCRALEMEPVVIVNRAEYRDGSLKEYCENEKLEILGEIPNDQDIARVYSRGELVVKELPHYRRLFVELGEKLINLAGSKRTVKETDESLIQFTHGKESGKTVTVDVRKNRTGNKNELCELVVISGKGGTGKTSLTAALASLSENTVVADCDVDASDLHLLLNPEIEEQGWFSGGLLAGIDPDECIGCGRCQDACRFDAVREQFLDEKKIYKVDPLTCEGCGVCSLVCEHNAVKLEEAVNGQWFNSRIKYGTMAHARLGMAEENSGQLVTLTRQKAEELSANSENKENIIDGSPGTGCPVIASLTGARYALVVTEPTVSGEHDMQRIFELTSFLDVPAGVVINKWDINSEISERIKRSIPETGVEFLGKLPYDERITQAQMKCQTIIEYAPESEISKSIKEIWEKLKEYSFK